MSNVTHVPRPRNSKTLKPKYEVGQVFGRLTITKQLEHSTRGLINKMHWYEARCECGDVSEYNQNQFRMRIECQECQNRHFAEKMRGRKKGAKVETISPGEGIPNFARMKLC